MNAPRQLMPVAALITVLFIYPFLSAQGKESYGPDLTREVLANTKSDFHLGPTGARGWMYVLNWRIAGGLSTTRRARQILITSVKKGTPADTVLKPGDVILGIGNTPFKTDARVALADAINEAETQKGAGRLKLLCWRPNTPDKKGAKMRASGKKGTLTLKLPVLGSFSKTAPYNCPKSEALLKRAVHAMIQEGEEKLRTKKGKKGHPLSGRLDLPALALLATGEKEYMPLVQSYIRPMKPPKIADNAWDASYRTILVAEYYLLTKDKSVLPLLRGLVMGIAKGQDSEGTYCGTLVLNPDGSLRGYGTLNQVGLTCFIAMLLSEKCGINDPVFTRALAKTRTYFSQYIDMGAIPYSSTRPQDYMLTHNGRSGSAAVAFSIDGNRAGVRHFANLCTAAHRKIETGHTGHFFNVLWTQLGANEAGPYAAAAYAKRLRWFQTITRKPNGGFLHQEGHGSSRTNYHGLNSTAIYILHLSMPRRVLYITGKGQDKSNWVTRKKAEEWASMTEWDYKSMDNTKLLELLGHESSYVRRKAVDALDTGDKRLCAEFMKRLRSTTHQRLGALMGLARLGSKAAPAAAQLFTIATSRKEKHLVRILALSALVKTGPTAKKYLPQLVSMYLKGEVIPSDPQSQYRHSLAWAVMKLIGKDNKNALNRSLFSKLVLRMLQEPDTRQTAMGMIKDIPLKDFHLYADAIIKVIMDDTVATDWPKQVGLKILNRFNVKEGMEYCILSTNFKCHGIKWRIPERMKQLVSYGSNAKEVLPLLEKHYGARRMKKPEVKAAVAKIKKSTKKRKLISLKQAVEYSKRLNRRP